MLEDLDLKIGEKASKDLLTMLKSRGACDSLWCTYCRPCCE